MLFDFAEKLLKQKYSAISRDPFYGFKQSLVTICVKIAQLIAE